MHFTYALLTLSLFIVFFSFLFFLFLLLFSSPPWEEEKKISFYQAINATIGTIYSSRSVKKEFSRGNILFLN